MKAISAEGLIRSIANDPEINGANFARMKRHIDNMPELCVCCGTVIPEGRQVCPNCERNVMQNDK